MKTRSQTLGAESEKVAADFLRSKGYAIVDRNVRLAGGEIDLVARTGDTLVIAEVKAGGDDPDFPPHFHLDARKRARLLRLAKAYSERVRHRGECRIDLLAVTWTAGRPQVDHFENVVQDAGP